MALAQGENNMKVFLVLLTLFLGRQSFAKTTCEFAIKPDGTDPMKQIGNYEVPNDPSKVAGILMPIKYNGLNGKVEVSPSPLEKGWIGIRFRYLDEKDASIQSNTSIIEMPSKSGAKFKTTLSFPSGNILALCKSI